MSKKQTPEPRGFFRIMGVDTGLGLCGFGFIDVYPGQPPRTYEDGYGVIETPKTQTTAQRLVTLAHDFETLLAIHQPDVVSVEIFLPSPHVMHNAPPVLQARGVILLVAQQAGIPIHEYTASAVKLSVAGHGKADKADVQEAVTERLGLEFIPRPDDAADALANAYKHFLEVESGVVAS